MFRLTRKRRSAGWPFWLLIAAWFCANSPQVAVYELVTWIGNARHFSHQQRLHADVASILAGENASTLVAAVNDAPGEPLLPPIPAEASLKKIELAMQRTSEFLPPATRAHLSVESTPLLPDTLRDQPPHEPPRARLMS